MPYVNIKLAGELTSEQRAEIAKGVTEILERVAGKPANAVLITIEDIPRNKWARGGELLEK